MASITLTIPNAVTQRVLDGFCKNQGYAATLENGTPNPETQQQFMKRKIVEYVKTAVKASELETARNAAATTANDSVDKDIVLT